MNSSSSTQAGEDATIKDQVVSPRSIRWWPLVVSSIAGGMIGGLLVGWIDPVLSVPSDIGPMPLVPSPEFMQRYNAAYRTMSTGNGAINFNLMGACIGAASILAIGWRSKAPSQVIFAILVMLGGAAGGSAAGRLLASASETQGRLEIAGIALDPMLQTLLFQAIAWGGIGLALGAAVAVQYGRPATLGMTGGLLGALAAALMHAVIGSVVFPNADSVQLIPASVIERCVWVIYCCGALSVGVLLAVRRQPAAGTVPGQ